MKSKEEVINPIIPTQEQKQDLHFAFDVPKQETIDEVAKDLNYWKNNAEEDYFRSVGKFFVFFEHEIVKRRRNVALAYNVLWLCLVAEK